MLPQADLFRHDGEIAARQLDLPELLRPVCAVAGSSALEVLQRRIALLHCPQSASTDHVCAALCSVCRWRFAHQCAIERLASAEETPCQLTARGCSPEFDAVIAADTRFACAVASVLIDGIQALTPLAQAVKSMLLIRRQTDPDELLWPLFRIAVLHLMADSGLPTRLAAHPDLIQLIVRNNKRIFYLLTVYFVSVVARTELIAPWTRIDNYDALVQQTRDALTRVVVDLSVSGQIGQRTDSCVDGVNYIRLFRKREELSLATECDVAAAQALYVRCCGRLAYCAPLHPRTRVMLDAMRTWSLRRRTLHDIVFDELTVRYICLGCMKADAPVVLDARGVMFCMDCDNTSLVWVNPMHLLLTTAGDVRRPPRRAGPKSCVVGPHTLRSNDVSFPILDGALLCEDHARSHAWLAAANPEHAPLLRRLLMSKRLSDRYVRSAARYAPIRF